MNALLENYRKILKEVPRLRVMVIGDLIADEYVLGMSSRVSREAPVLILRYDSRRLLLGGAANAVHNIRCLGGKVFPVGVVGNDNLGKELLGIFRQKGIERAGIIVNRDYNTTVKTRILAGGLHTTRQQVIRVDREENVPLKKEIEEEIRRRIRQNLKKVDAILVSDYGLGVVSDRIIEDINEIAETDDKIVAIDSCRNLMKFRWVTAATPNEPEVEEILGITLKNNRDVERAGRKIIRGIRAKSLLITRGKEGMALFVRKKMPEFIPIFGSDEIADVTGAGDTVIASFTLAIAAGADELQAARLANIAAGLVVMKSGTATVTPKEILQAIG
ncbi:MAG: bifunctional hydroxymethylpyrimidine kinase/phosphomethylpyrimidine kinase [Deltaproteobacteria bacterium]|nr:MAG: bifunctional hydroxymethylpyrimidine kinase/phosphomethylpyrimidine kinase [Deltaproteobacteria bacterium]